MPSGRTNNSPESGRGLGHVTPTILAVQSAILATAWLLVAERTRAARRVRLRQFNVFKHAERVTPRSVKIMRGI